MEARTSGEPGVQTRATCEFTHDEAAVRNHHEPQNGPPDLFKMRYPLRQLPIHEHETKLNGPQAEEEDGLHHEEQFQHHHQVRGKTRIWLHRARFYGRCIVEGRHGTEVDAAHADEGGEREQHEEVFGFGGKATYLPPSCKAAGECEDRGYDDTCRQHCLRCSAFVVRRAVYAKETYRVSSLRDVLVDHCNEEATRAIRKPLLWNEVSSLNQRRVCTRL
jgi:hypothetical protein